MTKFPRIKTTRKTGMEVITSDNGESVCDLSSFWSWAYSDLIGNTERGALAEFIVSKALGIDDQVRINWDKFDLLSKDGIKIEVKSSGYIQTWDQEKLSEIRFGIQETYGWDSNTNTFSEEKGRHADTYVFCVHNCKKQEDINPLNLSQWDFYVLPTAVLNEKAKGQKSISLSGIINLGATKCTFSELRKAIESEGKNSRKSK